MDIKPDRHLPFIYTHELVLPLILKYIALAPYGRIKEEYAEIRNEIALMIVEYCRERDDLPDPYIFFRKHQLGNGRFGVRAMNRFVMKVYAKLQELNDPDREIPYDEHHRSVWGLHDA